MALEKVSLFGLVIEAGRSINFGLVKADEARQIFIQQALVEGELGGRFAFLARNQKLIAGLADLEDRMRRRDILVDDFLLYEFYDKRLPDDVFDRAGLIRFLKKLPDDALVMEKADILRTLPESDELADYPQNVHCGELSFPLSYAFLPGSDEDGVTVKFHQTSWSMFSRKNLSGSCRGFYWKRSFFCLKGCQSLCVEILFLFPKPQKIYWHRWSFFRALCMSSLKISFTGDFICALTGVPGSVTHCRLIFRCAINW